MSSVPAAFERYARQIRFPPIGESGQQQLSQGRVLLCGCGALGSVLANTLVRAGVGQLRIVDRDFVELSNLQRQSLFDESDVASGLPKAIAAQRRLQAINSQVNVEGVVADVTHRNLQQLVQGVHLILDGTDNFETRFLLNDASLKFRIPWIFGGCIGAEGQTLTVLPGETPCLRCLMPDTPPPGTTPTCDTAGILAPIVEIVASWQAVEAIKILSGNRQAVSRTLNVIDVWSNRVRQIQLDALRDNPACPACQGQEFPWLEGSRGSHTAVLCGRNAVQLNFPEQHAIELEVLATRLAGIGMVQSNRYLVRASIGPYVLTVFADGRAIVGGTEDVGEAKSIYARYIGN